MHASECLFRNILDLELVADHSKNEDRLMKICANVASQ